MDAQPPQFTGSPCGHCGSYVFYRGFRYTKNGSTKDLSLGEFFFVRISAHEDPCIGELHLLCENNDRQLSALRLYFLPEQTPDGRLPHHGQDELLVASDQVVLKLDDLVGWITEEVEWNHGIISPQCTPKEEPPPSSLLPGAVEVGKEEVAHQDIKQEETSSTVEIKKEPIQNDECSKETKVVVLSYQKYCRFRTILKRIEGGGEHWLQDPLVVALGGFIATNQKTRILFCRENFEHDELAHHELNCEYLAPTIKGKRKKKKNKNTRSTSPESNSSEECKVIELKNNQKSNGLKQAPVKNEQEFLQKLFRFMKQRKTPIHRVPHLGFKQIDLYIFFSFAQKLGGYDKITSKRLWKHVYDELGGNPGSTSAATCTRRHYERLLLPFERFMDGIDYKPTTRSKKILKNKPEHPENVDEAPVVKNELLLTTNTETNDAYNFTDSNHENSNSRDSNFNEFNSVCDEQAMTNEAAYSDEDSKTVWSIQKQPETKDEADKGIKPLIIQKGQNETFAEKERKWDEIRKKNAAARKWVRQSRSSRNCKTPTPDVTHLNDENLVKLESDVHKSQMVKVSSENNENKNVPLTSNHSHPLQNNIKPSLPTVAQASSKINLPVHSEAIQNVINKLENQKRHKKDEKIKSEPLEAPKSWSGYCASSSFSITDGPLPVHIRNQMVLKSGSRSESDCPMPPHTGRQSVGSMSISSTHSVDTSINGDNKSQRRPSVIQHTEYAATTPSPTVSPKETDIFNMYPKNMQFSNPQMNLPPNHLSYSMTGKVAEWLTKGIHQVVACKTPSSNADKALELHDKVMMPSSCKTPGIVGTGKIPTSTVKSRHGFKNSPKSPRSKCTTAHQQNNTNTHLNVMPQNPYMKTFHPTPVTFSSSAMASPSHFQHTANSYSNNPHYNQQKQFKCNNIPPIVSGVNTRPSLLPFLRQQTYRASPLSDIPKATSTHNDYDSVVLDLSVKKKTAETEPPSRTVVRAPSPVPEEGVCLDLSVKKKINMSNDNGIENITPPLPLSPNPQASYVMKPLPTLIAIQDFQSSSVRHNYSSGSARLPQMTNNHPSSSSTPVPPPQVYSAGMHNKMAQNMGTYSKAMAKSFYMPSTARHSPYVIPPFFPSNWTSVVNANAPNSQTSPVAYKGIVNHSVFPKNYPSQYKSQFHPVLCKDNIHYKSK